jgi:KTSC domain-containing protein
MPSSVIRHFHYRPEEAELEILFTTGRRYVYRDVPPETADAFRAAFSKGRYFNAHIRDEYDFSEVGTVTFPTAGGRISADGGEK